jgi:LacI family transcriptional regulator
MHFSRERLRGFNDVLKARGLSLSKLTAPPSFRSRARSLAEQQKNLGQWLLELEKPVGLFAVTDYRARMILNVCLEHEFRVPEEVAVLGMDDDRVVCEHSVPTLSSIARPDTRIGYQAAACLDRLMQGLAPEHWETLVPPPGVIERASTQTQAIEDKRLLKAVNYINAHAHEGISIEQVCSAASVSRRLLEGLFRQELHCTPHRYMLHRQLSLACRLLSQPTRRPFDEIAQASGFQHNKRLYTVFQRNLNITPSEYRRRALNEAESPPPLTHLVAE